MKRLKLAITKGRLLDDSIALFEKMCIDASIVKNPGRKLILELPDYPLDIVLAKAPDVITYVEHGVCELGIVGKDTIMEQGGTFYEALDLGFGQCRFALAVPSGTVFFGGFEHRRVATKYPNVAKNWFISKGVDVSVIKIDGSVETAPLLGLCDGIVDIVQTGSTLEANGLEAAEDIAAVSARLIVNSAAIKLFKTKILDFIEKCRMYK